MHEITQNYSRWLPLRVPIWQQLVATSIRSEWIYQDNEKQYANIKKPLINIISIKIYAISCKLVALTG
ncbi:hypothetical protein DVQ24_06475 [Yersinia enterocolitica]|nr:hypothetical protein [Yersinia enterocolitica]